MFLFLAALVAGSLTAPAPSANDTWADYSEATALRVIDSAPEVPMGFASRPMPDVVSSVSAATPLFVNFVGTAPSQNGVPCFSCVNGGQSDTLGMTVPYNYAAQGSYQNYLVSWTALHFHGSCHIGFTIAAGGTVLDRFSYTFKGLSDGAYDAWADRPVTGYSGPAVVVVKLKCFGEKTVSAIGRAPIVYQ